MSTIKLTTLTPVHVGSGNLLQYNTDFITFRQADDDFIGVIDDKQVLRLIGEEHINDWVLSIERKENTCDFVRRYAPQSKLGDYIKRTAFLYHSINKNDTLKECMHDGMGKPYIPGSSLKGAIRTAITATLANQLSENSKTSRNIRNLASEVEHKLFGNNPNNDIFRFIKVGDAYFEKDVEAALRLVMGLNLTKQNDLKSNNNIKPQLVEAIGEENETVFSMKIDADYYRWIKSQQPSVGSMPIEVQSLQLLFELINNHTRMLLEKELKIWTEIKRDKTGADIYLERIQEMLDACNDCGKNSCVLRLGHASGWRFITGAWGEQLSAFGRDIPNAARPGNERKYSEYMFPKSRRIDEDGYLFGFVKLTIV